MQGKVHSGTVSVPLLMWIMKVECTALSDFCKWKIIQGKIFSLIKTMMYYQFY